MFVRVQSVVGDGEDEVYDVVMTAPYHSFVANGIVVHNCAELGGVKNDLLGLRHLDTLDHARQLIYARHGVWLDYDHTGLSVPRDCTRVIRLGPEHYADPAIWDQIDQGQTTGVFQLETPTLTGAAIEFKPRNEVDVAVLTSIVRPGVSDAGLTSVFLRRRAGLEPVVYDHPLMERFVGPKWAVDTHGILCVSGDTVIWDVERGPIALRDAHRSREVVSVDDEGHPVRGRVLGWGFSGVKSVVRVSTNSARHVVLTHDHQLLTLRGWLRAEELIPGDHLALPSSPLPTCVTGNLSAEQARWLGYLIADGVINVGGQTYLTTGDEAVADDFAAITSRLFPELWISRRKRGQVYMVYLHGARGRGTKKPKAYNSWLRELGFVDGQCYAHEKFVPNSIVGASDKVVAEFIAALWSCDGSVSEDGVAYYCTVSASLARVLSLLLDRLGIFHRLFCGGSYESTRVVPGSREVWRINVSDLRFTEVLSGCVGSFPHEFSGRGRSAFRVNRSAMMADLATEMGREKVGYKRARTYLMERDGIDLPMSTVSEYRDGSCPTSSTFVQAYLAGSVGVDNMRNSQLSWVEVSEVAPAGVIDTYDVSIADHHNFVGNGVVLHNCYQEQIIECVQELAAFTADEADDLRKAIGKKIQSKIDSLKDKFIQGCLDNDEYMRLWASLEIGKAGQKGLHTANHIWASIEASGRYAFNWSHGVAYSLISTPEIWIKHYYPQEYLVALMQTDSANINRYVREAKRKEIPILPPDANLSEQKFTIEENAIRYGLDSIRGVGAVACRDILKGRPYRSLEDFLRRSGKGANKTSVEGLIHIGAFDSIGTREELIDQLERMRACEGLAESTLANAEKLESTIARRLESGRYRLTRPDFSDPLVVREIEERLVGTLVTVDPLERYLSILDIHALRDPMDLISVREGDVVIIGGEVSAVRTTVTKKGRTPGAQMAHITVSWNDAEFRITVWPEQWRDTRDLLKEGVPVAVRAKKLKQGCCLVALERLDIMLDQEEN